MKILISVVSHDQQVLVENLLRSMDRYIKCSTHQVIIVLTENCRTSNYASSEKFELKRINNLRQKGFGANHNAAFERFESDFFFIVNPDILLTEILDLDLIVNYVLDFKIDIGSPVILNWSGIVEDYKRSDISFWNLLKRKIFKSHQERFDWLAGMFLVVSSESFGKLRGFDSKFFMYVEDCDLSMRARKAGMNVEDLNDFSVVHDARRSSLRSFKHLKWHLTSLFKYWFLK